MSRRVSQVVQTLLLIDSGGGRTITCNDLLMTAPGASE